MYCIIESSHALLPQILTWASLSTLSTLKYMPFLFLKTLFSYPLTIAHRREIETNPRKSDIIQ